MTKLFNMYAENNPKQKPSDASVFIVSNEQNFDVWIWGF